MSDKQNGQKRPGRDYIALGLVLGISIGAAMGNIAVGIAIGAALSRRKGE